MSNWTRKKTGETVEAMQWSGDYLDPEINEFLGEAALLALAISDAHPGDWMIKSPDHVSALIPRAFHEAYEPVTDEDDGV